MYMGMPQVQDAMKHIPEYLITAAVRQCLHAVQQLKYLKL